MYTDREPDQRRHAQCQQSGRHQGRQTHQRHAQRRDSRIRQHIHPAAVRPVKLKHREHAEQDASHHAARQSRIGEVQGEHRTGAGGLVQAQSRQRGKNRQQDHNPCQSALQEPPQFHLKQPYRFHRRASLEIR